MLTNGTGVCGQFGDRVCGLRWGARKGTVLGNLDVEVFIFGEPLEHQLGQNNDVISALKMDCSSPPFLSTPSLVCVFIALSSPVFSSYFVCVFIAFLSVRCEQ